MKVGYKWLKDYVAFEWTPEELAERLTAIGTAVDGLEPVYERFRNVLIGRITKVERHPQRPDLSVLVVDLKGRMVRMVSGAPNARQGMMVAAALPGADLPSLKGQRLEIREIDGVASEGMCCSELELGISDEGSVLIDLDPEVYNVGDDFWEALELEDTSISFELTPNRSDCLSVIGIAREISSLVQGRVRRAEVRLTETSEQTSDRLRVRINYPEGCPRYAGRLILGGKVGPSPFWMKHRIRSAGMRPINNAVDITNYVMLETGQPLHAFDWAKFPGGQVVVRAANAGEKFKTLDDVERTLPAQAVMITDGETPVAIGGVMGGADSEVTAQTTDFLLESAHFTPSYIRRTRMRLGLATESALRFEKTVDPNGVRYALDRAAQLFAQLTGGEVLAEPVDEYPTPIEPLKLELEPERVNSVLGTNLASPLMISILSNLEFGVVTGKPATITVPTFRPDITREIDLIEEIARVYGYERIPVDRRASGALPTHREPAFHMSGKVRDILEGLGLSEMVNNSLVDPKNTYVDKAHHVVLRNPLSVELSILRPELVAGCLASVARNRNRQVDSIAVYEIGRVFQLSGGDPGFDERTQLIIALCGQVPTAGWGTAARAFDFFDLKGIVEEFLRTWIETVSIQPHDQAPYATGQGFKVTSGDDTLGSLGLIESSYAGRLDVKDSVWAALLDFHQLQSLERTTRQYVQLPRYPAAFRDLAVVVEPSTRSGDLERTIREAGGDLVEGVRLFDRYSGTSISEGKISLAFSISYRVPDRTLTDQEVDAAHQAIVAALANNHGATLRQ